MKKRLRKKKRVGEFAQYGFELSAAIVSDDVSGLSGSSYLDGLLDEFVDYIESLSLFCGGGISPSRQRGFDFIVELGTKDGGKGRGIDKNQGQDKNLELNRAKVIDWVKSKPCFSDVRASEIFDLWQPPREVLVEMQNVEKIEL